MRKIVNHTWRDHKHMFSTTRFDKNIDLNLSGIPKKPIFVLTRYCADFTIANHLEKQLHTSTFINLLCSAYTLIQVNTTNTAFRPAHLYKAGWQVNRLNRS